MGEGSFINISSSPSPSPSKRVDLHAPKRPQGKGKGRAEYIDVDDEDEGLWENWDQGNEIVELAKAGSSRPLAAGAQDLQHRRPERVPEHFTIWDEEGELPVRGGRRANSPVIADLLRDNHPATGPIPRRTNHLIFQGDHQDHPFDNPMALYVDRNPQDIWRQNAQYDYPESPPAGPSARAPSPQPPVAGPSATGPNAADGIAHETNEELASRHLASVLALMPDVQPAHASELIQKRLLEDPSSVTQWIINYLIDNPDYPKIEKKGKKRAREEEATSGKGKEKEPKIDWASLDRQPPDIHYAALAIERLAQEFRYITKSWLRQAFELQGGLYYPTYFYIQEASSAPHFPYRKKTATGKSKLPPHLANAQCPYLDDEIHAVQAALGAGLDPSFSGQPNAGPSKSGASASAADEEPDVPEGEGIECSCCFGEYAFENMIQCPDAHLFCKTCARRNAEECIGNRKHLIRCMDQGGCKLEFSEAELQRFLDAKALELLERIRAEKAVQAAGLEGLEECPFCDYKCIIENDQERLFRCANEDCGIFSCRQCKKEDHLPKTCQEMEADRKLDARHFVEEAMTAALMRHCPKCTKAFVKELGCNKMRCPYCETLSCYNCRAIISGYDHFDQQPGGPNAPSTSKSKGKKCPLWDDVDKRHHEEVAEAARIAAAKQKEENPDVDDNMLKVDLPPAPPPRAHPPGYIPVPQGGAPPLFNVMALPFAAPHIGQQPLPHIHLPRRNFAEDMRRRAQEMEAEMIVRRAELLRRGEELQAEQRRAHDDFLDHMRAHQRAQPAIQALPYPLIPARPAPPAPARVDEQQRRVEAARDRARARQQEVRQQRRPVVAAPAARRR